MKSVCIESSELKDKDIFDMYEEKYGVHFDDDFKVFFTTNNGGIPKNNTIVIDKETYEVRCFLSFNSGEYNSIDLPFDSFQEETDGKIYPIAKDSGDNYYCVNNETGKVYYWNKDDNLYYELTKSFLDFVECIE